MENAIAIRPMIYKEAREAVDQINSNMNNVRYLVLDLYEREGWVALGYQSWRECVATEFKQGQSYLYYQLEAAQIEKNISTTVEKEQIPERQLRPLSKLEPDQQREAWQKAVETAPDGKVTAAHVSKVVKEMTGPEKPKPYVLHKPIIEKELVSEDFQSAYDSMIVELKNCLALKWKTTSYKAALEMMKNLVTITEQMGR
jgi:hypothetical protein